MVRLGYNLIMGTAVTDADCLVDLPLVATPDTAAAHDALGEIPDNHAVVVFIIILGARGVSETGGRHLIAVSQTLQFALAIGLADQAVVVAGTQDQLQDHLA